MLSFTLCVQVIRLKDVIIHTFPPLNLMSLTHGHKLEDELMQNELVDKTISNGFRNT